ncbi:MAG: hypothetical protein K6T57_15280 [Thermaceae bacterium]|nr:hypothetical protein [Thermaceae bacterium]
MDISTLSQLSGLSERALRRGLGQIQQTGGRVHLQDNRLSGPDLPCFLATLYDLQISFAEGQRPSLETHFAWMKAQSPERWVIPQEWPQPKPAQPGGEPAAAQPALRKLWEENEKLKKALEAQEQTLARLEQTLLPLAERFSRVEKALRHIDLVLEDEDADNNLYNILISHIGGFNDRLTFLEGHLAQLTRTVAGGMVKFADDDREIKHLLQELLRQVSPR